MNDILLCILAMVALFIFALACMNDMRNQYRAEAALPADIIDLRSGGLEGNDPPTVWQERYLQAIPGIFLVVGLLGTFIGLANAIGAAGDALKHGGHSVAALRRQFDDLSRAVDGIGVKFLSSLAGIGFHLATRLLHGLLVSPMHELREEARRRARMLSSERLVAWRVAREEALVAGVVAIQKRLAEIAVLPDQLRGELDSLARLAQENREVIRVLDVSAKGATESAKRVEESVRAAGGLTETMATAGRNLSEAAAKSAELLGDAMAACGERITSSIDAAASRMEGSAESLQTATTVGVTAVADAAKRCAGVATKLDSTAKRGVEVSARLHDSLNEFRQQSVELSQVGSGLASAVAASVASLDASVNSAGERIAHALAGFERRFDGSQLSLVKTPVEASLAAGLPARAAHNELVDLPTYDPSSTRPLRG